MFELYVRLRERRQRAATCVCGCAVACSALVVGGWLRFYPLWCAWWWHDSGCGYAMVPHGGRYLYPLRVVLCCG
ncbi:hypothetical protein Taro_055821, partial [Colocasia esculenta]|nr:hypothetical protein [Colocasia esculenta]